MAMKLGQVVLFSRARDRLVNFLTELFDLELQDVSDGLMLKNQFTQFLVVEADKSQLLATNGDMILDFFVDSREELETFLQKAEFCFYRQGPNNDHIKRPTINYAEGIFYFYLRDPDGRRWSFSFRE
jgi:hypothetical protein